MEMMLLRSLRNGLQTLSAQDKVAFMVKGTMTTTTLSVNLNGIVRKGAVVHYWNFKSLATDSTTGALAATAAVGGSGTEVMVMVVVDQGDLEGDIC